MGHPSCQLLASSFLHSTSALFAASNAFAACLGTARAFSAFRGQAACCSLKSSLCICNHNQTYPSCIQNALWLYQRRGARAACFWVRRPAEASRLPFTGLKQCFCMSDICHLPGGACRSLFSPFTASPRANGEQALLVQQSPHIACITWLQADRTQTAACSPAFLPLSVCRLPGLREVQAK